MARRSTLRLAACAVAVLLVLAGCSEKHQASQSLPSTKTSTSASKTMPPVGPADFPVPAEARQKSSGGVLAFTRYYFDLSNYLLKSLDSAPLRDLSRGCQTCTELADGYDKAKANGLSFDGGSISVTDTGSVSLKNETAEVSLVLQQSAVTVRDSAGAVLQDQSSAAYTLGGGIALGWDGERQTWLVTRLDAKRQ
jgi:hypothetical protein